MTRTLASLLLTGLLLTGPAAFAQTDDMPDLPGSNVVAGSLPEEPRQPRAARAAQVDDPGTDVGAGLEDLPGVGTLPDDTLNAARDAQEGARDPAPAAGRTAGGSTSDGGNLPRSGAPIAAMGVIGAWTAILGGIFATWARLVRRARPAA